MASYNAFVRSYLLARTQISVRPFCQKYAESMGQVAYGKVAYRQSSKPREIPRSRVAHQLTHTYGMHVWSRPECSMKISGYEMERAS